MTKTRILFIVFILSFSTVAMAQQTREELEKQRAELKKELEQTERLLGENKAKAKVGYMNCM